MELLEVPAQAGAADLEALDRLRQTGTHQAGELGVRAAFPAPGRAPGAPRARGAGAPAGSGSGSGSGSGIRLHGPKTIERLHYITLLSFLIPTVIINYYEWCV